MNFRIIAGYTNIGIAPVAGLREPLENRKGCINIKIIYINFIFLNIILIDLAESKGVKFYFNSKLILFFLNILN